MVVAAWDTGDADPGDEAGSGTGCGPPPPGRQPVVEERLSFPDPEPERGLREVVTMTDAHGRVCTASASHAGTEEPLFGDDPFGEGVEIDLTCEYVQTGAVAAEEPAGSSG